MCHDSLTLRRWALVSILLLLGTLPAASVEPPPLLLSIDGAPALGNAQAKVVVVEFSDYQ